MAHKGKEIRNPKTGQTIQFVKTRADTNGRYLELISTYESHSKEPIPHYHPRQDEYFEVLQGELSVRLKGKLTTLQPGDTIHIERNTVHSMWNGTAEKTVISWKTVPAMDTEYLLELNTGLANDDKTNADGVPDLLQVALMMNHYDHVFRVAKPPFFVQKVIFGILTPFARLLGYKSYYQKYID
ncbi:cupin domain-containing protein [Larkinella terrae]|uniref:Cupin domain-containing protein n=1 Tax=Larkinella terrae TaxID=2025311 RepID=A0A7K0EN88_9BACT|nr:cupin domain-containing protein [Larkinella terrae]MRS62946.1 cupin domain-containing protein [Larkinella terrae]